MKDQPLKPEVSVDVNQPAPDGDVQRDLDVADADKVKGGGRLTDIRDGTSNTIMVGERSN